MHSGTGNRLEEDEEEEEYDHTHSSYIKHSITRSLIDTCTHTFFFSLVSYWISVSHSFVGVRSTRKIEFSDLLRFDNMAEDKIYNGTRKRVHRIGGRQIGA